MKKSMFILALFLLNSCKKVDFQAIYFSNKSDKDIYYLLSKDDRTINLADIRQIRPKASNIKFDKKNFVKYESKEDSLIARDNYMFPFRIKKDSEKRIFESMSEDVAINVVSIQQRIKENYDGKLNVYVIKANDLNNFSDNQIINNKLYKKIKSFKKEDIVSDSILVQFNGQ